MEELVVKIIATWEERGGHQISDDRGLEVAALRYLYTMRNSIDDIAVRGNIECKFLTGITAKEAVLASNILDSLVRAGIAEDPRMKVSILSRAFEVMPSNEAHAETV